MQSSIRWGCYQSIWTAAGTAGSTEWDSLAGPCFRQAPDTNHNAGQYATWTNTQWSHGTTRKRFRCLMARWRRHCMIISAYACGGVWGGEASPEFPFSGAAEAQPP